MNLENINHIIAEMVGKSSEQLNGTFVIKPLNATFGQDNQNAYVGYIIGKHGFDEVNEDSILCTFNGSSTNSYFSKANVGYSGPENMPINELAVFTKCEVSNANSEFDLVFVGKQVKLTS